MSREMPPTPPHGAAPADERPLAALAYLFTWLTGAVVFLVAKKDQRYLRWNALQAIGLGVAGVILGFLGSILSAIVFAGQYLDGRGPPFFLAWGGLGLFGALVAVLTLVLIVLGAIRAYQGKPLRLPLLSRLADRYA